MTDPSSAPGVGEVDKHDRDLIDALRAQKWAGVQSTLFRLTQPQAERLEAALSRPAPGRMPKREEVDWQHPDTVPRVKAGGEEYRIVAVRRAHSGKVYSFPATYLNQCVLRFEDENYEERPVTGWFSAVTGEDDEGESYQELLGKGDVLEAWCDLPDAPSDAILALFSAPQDQPEDQGAFRADALHTHRA